MSPAFTTPVPASAPAPAEADARRTYLLVDGENIDATLGMNVLNRRPNPEERPRWDRVTTYAQKLWGQDVVPLFFLNASSGQMPMSFVQALLAMGYRPIPLASSGTEKVVDVGIQRTLEALADRDGDVLLASHDGDFLPQIEALLGADRKVGLLAFREFVNGQFTQLTEQGLEMFDLEGDADAFTAPLPRVRIIPLDEFDPLRYL
ncbi:NYN domain-containing protein [Isoptericola sp. NEAU-Y5]|uniref:NYN domain-containing protein n=1 Tax=Isoptericola luteus TaxID=2879484 RepID=A0ABS7ZDA9_9MICO|nr:NYN domain-containing protein [Isoptericola sp. NEAU-Y5]MCA5893025.1 NYN domain-containing protein [Isoptericola sp. NEAU-Y5]